MKLQLDGHGGARRPKVAMLVHNDVRRDSRVQKTARSMAERGWDVLLLGCTNSPEPERWRLGDARVVLVPASRAFGYRGAHLIRTPAARDPLSYTSRSAAVMSEWRVQARTAELELLGLRRRHEQGDAASRARLLATWAPMRATVPLVNRVARLRQQRTENALRGRQQLTGRADLLVTKVWDQVLGDRSWRRLDPTLWRYEFAFGERLDRFRPDVIHANDWLMLGVAARAKLRAQHQGRRTRVVWDAHEYLPGLVVWNKQPRWHRAQLAHEREFAPYADAVVTVSPVLAEMLQEIHGLAELPGVVLNAPIVETPAEGERVPSMRELCGIDASVPLLTYSGGMTEQRGVGIMVEALPRLPGVHVAFVTATPDSPYVVSLVNRAKKLGVRKRVHLLPYVPYQHVVQFVAEADIGVHPTHHHPNHEISLATKFFEYSLARLPIVVSDVRTMADMVRSTGQGEVFRAQDLEDYVRAVTAVLADPARYRAAYEGDGLLDTWTWEAQADRLAEVYGRLLERNGHSAEGLLPFALADRPIAPAREGLGRDARRAATG